MADETPNTTGTGLSGISSSAESSLLSFLSNMNGNFPAGAEASAPPPANGALSLSSLLPTSGSVTGANTNSSLAPAASTLPIDADIDQLMKSLGNSVDTSKVSNEDIDKLLGSLNVEFPSDIALPGTSTSRAADTDPFASLSRDLGIDLGSSVSLPPTTATISNSSVPRVPGSSAFTAASSSQSAVAATGIKSQQQSYMSQQDMSSFQSDPLIGSQMHSGLHMASMPESPALSGIGGDNGGMQRPGHISQLQQGGHYRPATPRAQQYPGTMQQRALNASQSPGHVGPNKAATAHSSPGVAANQRPPRPQTPQPVSRSSSKQRTSFSEATASPRLPGSQLSNPGSRAESPSTQNRLSRHPSAQQSLGGDHNSLHGQHGMQQTGAPSGMNMRPQQRPQTPFGSGAVDPSRWLVETMSKLPAEHQEQIAGLFRGLQAKTIDFPTFMRDAKVVMGSKFQDLLAVMHNQGARAPNVSSMQQQQQSPSSILRTNNHFSMPNARPGMPLMASASPQIPISQGIAQQRNAMQHGALSGQNAADRSRNNVALIRQYLASHQSQPTSGEPSGSSLANKGSAPVSLNGQGAMAASTTSGASSSQDVSLGGFPAANMGNVAPETLISRWRQIILNPTIPAEQLARLSMQLSSFGNLIASPTGPMSHMPEEARNQQFVQITKLQALIAQRQFAHGSQAQGSVNSQPVSQSESPKPENNGKDAKKKSGAKSGKDEGKQAQPKKRPLEMQRSGSPAPRPGSASSKRQKTAADSQAGGDVETPAGSSISLDNNSSAGGAGGGLGGRGNSAFGSGLAASRSGGHGLPEPYVDIYNGYDNDSSVDYDDEDYAPGSTSLIRSGISRSNSVGTGAYNSDTDQDGISRGKYKHGGKSRDSSKDMGLEISRGGDSYKSVFANRERERIAGSRDVQRRPKDRREKDRSGAGGGGGDMFSINDVIGYTGVDLREESEMILGGGVHQRHGTYRTRDGAASSTRIIDGVEVSRDRSLEAGIANGDVLEELVSRVCKRSNIRAVSADAIPYLSLALQERLRSFMEMVSAAAYHRTRTQTLPPPPLDPSTRLPLYKITPHLDVKKQLVVLERMDKMREQNRQRLLVEREQSNVAEPQQPGDNEGDRSQASGADERRKAASTGAENAVGTPTGPATTIEPASVADNSGTDQPAGQVGSADTSDALKTAAAAASAVKRGRKRDDSAPESAAYTSKNMPDEIRNKISNQTALRAAGGVRKSWMNASSADWLGGASAGKASAAIAGSSRTTQPQPETLDHPPPALLQTGDSLRSGGGMPAMPHTGGHLPTKRTSSISSASGSIGMASFVDTGIRRPSLGHGRNRSNASNASDFDNVAVVSPAADGSQTPLAHSAALRPSSALLPHRSTALSAPLLVTVRDCLFSLERERLGSARAGRGSGDRVLIQAFSKYLLN